MIANYVEAYRFEFERTTDLDLNGQQRVTRNEIVAAPVDERSVSFGYVHDRGRHP